MSPSKFFAILADCRYIQTKDICGNPFEKCMQRRHIPRAVITFHPRFLWNFARNLGNKEGFASLLANLGYIILWSNFVFEAKSDTFINGQNFHRQCQLLSCLLRWAPFLIPFGSNLGSKRAPQKDSPFGHSSSRRELKEAGSKSGNRQDEHQPIHLTPGEWTCQMTAVTRPLCNEVGGLYLRPVDGSLWNQTRQTFTLYIGSGNRIGEAKNPGPSQQERDHFRLALVNPTTILHRKHDLLQLNADALALAETSATAKAQWETIRDFRSHHHACLFSAPVDNQKQRLDGETSWRGQASGTAVERTSAIH